MRLSLSSSPVPLGGTDVFNIMEGPSDIKKKRIKGLQRIKQRSSVSDQVVRGHF